MITSREVAKIANVSQSTVSRAFRDDVYIDPVTKQHVLNIANSLGYYPNLAARNLRKKESKIIGLMLTDPENIFFSSLTKAIEKYLTEKGYRVLLTYNNEDKDKERLCLELLVSSGVDGVLAMPASSSNKGMYEILKKNGISVIQLLRKKYDWLSSLAVNDELGTYIATKYLIEQGHKRIVLTEYIFNKEASAKTLGYRRACEEFGIDPEPGILNLPFKENLDGLIAGAIMERHATAIVSATQPITLSTLKACAYLNFKIPDDISVIAYDDSEWAEFLDLTVITHPMREIGKETSELFLEELKSIHKKEVSVNQDILIKPYLLLRQSVRNIEENRK